jgi:DNA-binding NtrC family response regulator
MNKPVVLLVDDEPLVTEALKRALYRSGLEIHAATSASSALALLSTRSVDVIVSDEQMPGMNGTEFLRHICQLHPRTIRIMLTGHVKVETAMRAINDGQVHRFLTKPCNEADLVMTIREALRLRDLANHSRKLLQEFQRQSAMLQGMKAAGRGVGQIAPGASEPSAPEQEHDVDGLMRLLEDAVKGNES